MDQLELQVNDIKYQVCFLSITLLPICELRFLYIEHLHLQNEQIHLENTKLQSAIRNARRNVDKVRCFLEHASTY